MRGTRSIGEAYRFVQTITDNEGRYRLTGLETPSEAQRRTEESMRRSWPWHPTANPTCRGPVDHRADGDKDAHPGFRLEARDLDHGPSDRQSDAASLTAATSIITSSKTIPTPPRRAISAANPVLAWPTTARTAEGTFRLVGLPGRGLLCARAGNEAYRMGVGAERIKEKKMTIGLETISAPPPIPSS